MNHPEDTEDHHRVCLVGYALNAKKLRKSEASTTPGLKNEWAGGGLADILQYSADKSSEEGISIVFSPWDPEVPPQNQQKFHVIIHKLTEDIEKEKDDTKSKEKITSLNNYLNYYPDTKIIDPLNAVRKVTSRKTTVETLQTITSYGRFQQPKFLIAAKEMTSTEIIDELHAENISYPIICKPLEACGTPLSHSMVVVVQEEDIHMVPKPCIIQQYHNHDGILYKAYVIDEDVMVYRRPSLPNLAFPAINERLLSSQRKQSMKLHSLAFDSRYSYPKLENFLKESLPVPESPKLWLKHQNGGCIPSSSSQEKLASLSSDDNEHKKRKLVEKKSALTSVPSSTEKSKILNISNELTPEDELFGYFVSTAKELKKAFGLSLFGFDVILPIDDDNGGKKNNKKLMVIDINYFPSYKEVKDFPDRLKTYLKKKAFFDSNEEE